VPPPLVSVVIPTRDRPGQVAGAIRSALGQEGALVEVCVVDDGSSPPLALPDDLAGDERVTLIRLDRSRGAAAARNVAIAATAGELIAFLDDDDEWLPGKLARQLEALRANAPGTAVVACGFDMWDGERLVTSRITPADVNSGGLLAHPCLCPSVALVTREALLAVGGFDESFDRVEDWDLWMRLSDLGPVRIVPEVLVDRRLSPFVPAPSLEARRMLAARIEPRLARLPAADAARLRGRFHADDGVLLAILGRRREALGVLLAALRDHPRSRTAAVGLARTITGERLWTAAQRLAKPLRARVRRGRRPPRPPGPAPRWASR
jgi:glycosyltransferase involved in cell wall biosynthesis